MTTPPDFIRAFSMPDSRPGKVVFEFRSRGNLQAFVLDKADAVRFAGELFFEAGHCDEKGRPEPPRGLSLVEDLEPVDQGGDRLTPEQYEAVISGLIYERMISAGDPDVRIADYSQSFGHSALGRTPAVQRALNLATARARRVGIIGMSR